MREWKRGSCEPPCWVQINASPGDASLNIDEYGVGIKPQVVPCFLSAVDPKVLGDQSVGEGIALSIGPSSELVCGDLERQYPGATLTVENRSIHSPTEVSVVAAVDGTPMSIRYSLSGFRWRPDATGTLTANVPSAQTTPSTGN